MTYRNLSMAKSKLAILYLLLVVGCASGQNQSSPSLIQQRLNEMRYDLINGTVKNSVRVAASPIKFGWKEWAATGVVAGAVGVAFSQDRFFYDQFKGGEDSKVRSLAIVGEAFSNPWIATGTTLGAYVISKGLGYDKVADPALVAFHSVLITGGATTVLKLLTHRQRPREGTEPHPYTFYGPSFYNGNFSFPSAHTATAFALASSMSTYYKDKKWVPAVLYPLAALSGWSRIHDNEHWFSDVVGGAAIGYFVGRTVAGPELYRWSVMPNSSGGTSLSFTYSF